MRNYMHVGNLGPSTTDAELERLFAPYGTVRRATVVVHADTGRSTGVGFVEMASDEDGDAAIAMLAGRLYRGQPLLVCWSQPRPQAEARGPQEYGAMNMPEQLQGWPAMGAGPTPGGYGDRSGVGRTGQQFFVPGQGGDTPAAAAALSALGPFVPVTASDVAGSLAPSVPART